MSAAALDMRKTANDVEITLPRKSLLTDSIERTNAALTAVRTKHRPA